MAPTQLVMGRSPLDVKRQLGPGTLIMTDHYASLTTEQLSRSHEKYSPLRAESESKNRGLWFRILERIAKDLSCLLRKQERSLKKLKCS